MLKYICMILPENNSANNTGFLLISIVILASPSLAGGQVLATRLNGSNEEETTILGAPKTQIAHF